MGALFFVARRLAAERIAMLFAARDDEMHDIDAHELPALTLRGLDAQSAAALIAHAANLHISPPVQELLIANARGNALALVELPAALTEEQLAGVEPVPETVPLTRGLERLFLDRVRRLPGEAQRLLTILAANDSGRLAPALQAAEALGIGTDALDAAERVGLVSVRGPSFELRHPLVRTAVYQGASSAERRAAHLALADALNPELEPDQCAWHRAAAVGGPDDEVADELEHTAERARLRSGHGAAAAALKRSAEITADPEAKARRLVGAAAAAWHAGQPSRASALLDEAAPLDSDWRVRADARHLRGEIELRCGVLVDACDTLIEGAVEVAPFDIRKALEMLLEAREAAGWAGDMARTVGADRAAAALPRTDDAESRFLADLLVGVGSVYEGNTALGTQMVLDAIARADDFDEPSWLAWAAMGARAVGDEGAEAALMSRAVAVARASGAVDKLTYVLLAHVLAELLAARLRAVAEAAEGLTLAREAALPNAASTHLAMLAWFAAVRGDEGECLAHSSAAKELAEPRGAGFANSIAEWGLGLLALSSGRADDAVRHLTAVRNPRPGVGHPYFALTSAPDLVEAHVRAGRRDAAADAFELFESFAQPGAPAWGRALAARCQALLSEGTVADDLFEEALRLHGEAGRTFDGARTALLLGERRRRQRRRRESRQYLQDALEAFELLGASAWAERAGSELQASGATARKRDPSAVDQLTPQELQISRLVADGLTNKEIAAHLFLSPRTIDAHLRNVFGKLGLTSRTQLARLPLGAAEQVAVAS